MSEFDRDILKAISGFSRRIPKISLASWLPWTHSNIPF